MGVQNSQRGHVGHHPAVRIMGAVPRHPALGPAVHRQHGHARHHPVHELPGQPPAVREPVVLDQTGPPPRFAEGRDQKPSVNPRPVKSVVGDIIDPGVPAGVIHLLRRWPQFPVMALRQGIFPELPEIRPSGKLRPVRLKFPQPLLNIPHFSSLFLDRAHCQALDHVFL